MWLSHYPITHCWVPWINCSCYHFEVVMSCIFVLQTLLLVEFAESGCVTELMRHSSSAAGVSVPVRSPFFTWVPQPAASPAGKEDLDFSSEYYRMMEMPKVLKENIISDEKLLEKMSICNSVSMLILIWCSSIAFHSAHSYLGWQLSASWAVWRYCSIVGLKWLNTLISHLTRVLHPSLSFFS